MFAGVWLKLLLVGMGFPFDAGCFVRLSVLMAFVFWVAKGNDCTVCI